MTKATTVNPGGRAKQAPRTSAHYFLPFDAWGALSGFHVASSRPDGHQKALTVVEQTNIPPSFEPTSRRSSRRLVGARLPSAQAGTYVVVAGGTAGTTYEIGTAEGLSFEVRVTNR